MQKTNVGFIGAGRVARIILGGWKHTGKMPARVVLFDTNSEAAENLASMGMGIDVTDNVAEATAQNIVFLAVHPPVMKDAAETMRPHIKEDAIVISLAPKFTISKLSEMLGGFRRIARLIPNAPSVVGRGYNPLAFSEVLSESEKQALCEMFEPLGDCPVVDENQLEAYAILSAMGPTYFWPQIFALQSLGEDFGLSKEATTEALDKMLWGTMATIKESGLSPEQVQDLIPVKPMADEVQTLCQSYEQKLKGLMEKIRP
ncbi:MAG: pyrroline-5-carboxylate reductase family protein [Candidatus Sumerlaeia bacterium]